MTAAVQWTRWMYISLGGDMTICYTRAEAREWVAAFGGVIYRVRISGEMSR